MRGSPNSKSLIGKLAAFGGAGKGGTSTARSTKILISVPSQKRPRPADFAVAFLSIFLSENNAAVSCLDPQIDKGESINSVFSHFLECGFVNLSSGSLRSFFSTLTFAAMVILDGGENSKRSRSYHYLEACANLAERGRLALFFIWMTKAGFLRPNCLIS